MLSYRWNAFLFILFIALSLSSAFSQSNNLNLSLEEALYLRSISVLKIQSDAMFPPLNYREYDEYKGYSNDYLRLLAEKMGVSLEWVEVENREESLSLLQSGELDIVSNLRKSEKGSDYFLYSEIPIMELKESLFIREGDDYPGDLSRMDGRNLALVKDSLWAGYIAENYPDINLLLTSDSLESFQQVLKGNAYATIESTALYRYMQPRYFISGLEWFPFQENNLPHSASYFLAVQNQHTLLKSLLDKAMKSLTEEDLQGLRHRWIEEVAVHKEGFLGTLTESERRYLQNKEELIYAIDPNLLPLEGIENGRHVGVSSDIIALLEERLGLPVVFYPTESISESMEALYDKKIDFIPISAASKYRNYYIRYSRSYYSDPLVLVTLRDKPYLTDLNNLQGETIATIGNYAMIGFLEQLYPNIDFQYKKDIDEGLRAVRKGSVYGFIDSLMVSGYHIQKSFPDLKISHQLNQNWEICFSIVRDEPLLESIINKALDSIDFKTRQQIWNSWNSVSFVPAINTRLIWKLSIAFSIVLILILYRYILLRKNNKRLEEMSLRDHLTQLYNRYYLDDYISNLQEQFYRYNQNYCLIICDIDHFKTVNDQFGHLYGDRILQQIGELFSQNIRNSDIVGRWGGEEFLIVCNNTALQGALSMAENLRKKVQNIKMKENITISCSFGVAQSTIGWDIDGVLSHADDALYFSKENGRNLVSYFYQEKCRIHDESNWVEARTSSDKIPQC